MPGEVPKVFPPASALPSPSVRLAVWPWRRLSKLALAVSMAGPALAAQTGPPAPRGFLAPPVSRPAPTSSGPGSVVRFLGGAALGLGMHEGSHLLADSAFGVDVHVRRVEFHGIPFFALAHESGLPAHQEYVIASAGLWTQHLSSEAILTLRPGLRRERAPFLKGVLAFDVLLSTGYGLAAVAAAGPPERDPRGMADGLGVSEPLVGGLILMPAAFDTWRYYRPEAKWPRRLSRVVKAGLVLVVLADLPL